MYINYEYTQTDKIDAVETLRATSLQFQSATSLQFQSATSLQFQRKNIKLFFVFLLYEPCHLGSMTSIFCKGINSREERRTGMLAGFPLGRNILNPLTLTFLM